MAFELMQKTLDLIFPTLCLHCQTKTNRQLFCQDCIQSLELLEKEDILLYRRSIDHATIAFSKMGVAESLFLHLKKGLKPLSKIAASYMVCQLEKEKIALSDVIVPLPSKGGYKLNETLALEVGKIFKRPIKRLFLHLSLSFFGSSLVVKKSNLHSKKILLVMALFDEGVAQKAISELQKKGFKDIDLVALCV